MKNSKYGKTRTELRQNHTIKVITLESLAGGWFRCNQTGKLLRRSQILSQTMEAINNQKTTILRPVQAQPKAKKTKYR